MKTTLSILNTLSEQIHRANREKGFYDNDNEIGTKLMLVVSELSEALEADRKNRYADLKTLECCILADDIDNDQKDNYYMESFEKTVKDTFEDEIADTMIRLFDLCGYLGIDIAKHIDYKLKYNSLRPYKHGKEY